jgi:hypothetical protein
MCREGGSQHEAIRLRNIFGSTSASKLEHYRVSRSHRNTALLPTTPTAPTNQQGVILHHHVPAIRKRVCAPSLPANMPPQPRTSTPCPMAHCSHQHQLHTCMPAASNRPPAARAHSQKDLPPSVESAYYRKCIDLRRRINDIEESNDSTRQRILRLNRGVQKMRLERAFLLEQLNKHMEYNPDDSDRSSSPPPTPTDKPLRSKRSHLRKATPPPGGAVQQQSPGSMQHTHQQILNPMSSAQSTPDPGRVSSGNYFSTLNTVVNGAPVLPPLHSLPPLRPEPARAYFDPAYDEQRNEDVEGAGRQRAYSNANAQQPPPLPPTTMPANGDTEMVDAGFTAVNRQA